MTAPLIPHGPLSSAAAARAYDEAILPMAGEFARLNFPAQESAGKLLRKD